jgi:hypothetical protein
VIKPEPVEDRIFNRKRSGTLSALQDIPPKKIKAGLENPSIAGVDTRLLPVSAEAIRSELLDLQGEINHLQPQLDRFRRKSGKTTAQLRKEMNITSQLIVLHQRRKELTEMLPAVSAPVHSIAGPSFQNGYVNGFAQPSWSLTFGATVPHIRRCRLWFGSFSQIYRRTSLWIQTRMAMTLHPRTHQIWILSARS